MRYVESFGSPGGCDMTFSDPAFDIMGDAREIAFRIALSGAQENTRQVEVQQAWSQTVYSSQHIFLFLAVAITLLATLCVFGISLGWWRLGREVSLSPVEVAKAFAALVLYDAGSNAEAEQMLRQVEKKRVRYGATWEDECGESEESVAALQFEIQGLCEKPMDGQVFGR